jgi:hypothetical protein
MKGPYERLKYQLDRIWECPVCQHHERRGGQVTYLFCRCQAEVPPPQQACMQLVRDGVCRVGGPEGELPG